MILIECARATVMENYEHFKNKIRRKKKKKKKINHTPNGPKSLILFEIA